ncbi:MAG: putative cytochrome c1 signal peptide protein, partial [Gammaproteobacteria bacterium]|nr:putative cytochrome c1 signal peptide protein [Gammaproteobacteria bacterium]
TATIAGLFFNYAAHALPSFARQTGMPCSQCHTVAYGPALTAYGRQFKLNGYVWGDAKPGLPPIALMVQGGFTHTSKDQVDPPAPHYATNDNLSVDQVSAFYGGRVSQHVGAFVQVTYSGPDRRTTWDNLDVRYARSLTIGGDSVVVGISVNNNPTVQDLWNSTPAWSFPYITSALAPSPAAAPVISGGLAQLALGATAYAMIADHLYVEAGAYRGLSDRWLSNVGLGPTDNLHMDGASPYWRATWQMDVAQHYFSLGTFGMNTKMRPDSTSPAVDRFDDVGVDATYQFVDDRGHALSANLSAIHEKQTLDASFAAGNSAGSADHLNTVSFDVGYAYRQTWVTSVGLFHTSGSTDLGLYTPSPLSGSLSGSPDSRGYVVQLEYIPFGKLDSLAAPWLNLRVGLQYTAYQRFNGGGNNYDGFGRSASDNDTLFGFIWMAL